MRQTLTARNYSSDIAKTATGGVATPTMEFDSLDAIAAYCATGGAGATHSVYIPIKPNGNVARRCLGMQGKVGASPADATITEDVYAIVPVHYGGKAKYQLLRLFTVTWPVLNASTLTNADVRNTSSQRRAITATLSNTGVLDKITTVDAQVVPGYEALVLLYDVGPFVGLVRVVNTSSTSAMAECHPTHSGFDSEEE